MDQLARLEGGVFSAFAPFAPLLLLVLLYAWPIRLARSMLARWSERFRHGTNLLGYPWSRLSIWISTHGGTNRLAILDRPKLALVIGMISASFLGYIPYRQDLNPTMTPIGVDTHLYVGWVTAMLQQPAVAALSYAFGTASFGSRPLILVILYSAGLITKVSSLQLIELLPLVLGPLLPLSTYVFVRTGRQDPRVAGLTALLTAFSYYLTVGLWAGYYANWLGLIWTYSFLASLMIFVRSRSTLSYASTLAFSLALLLTHPWTWAIIVTTTAAFVLSLWRAGTSAAILRGISALIAINVVVDVAKSEFLGAYTVSENLVWANRTTGAGQLASLWTNVFQGMAFTYDGLLSTTLILALAAFSAFRLRSSDNFDRLLLLWVLASSLPFPFLAGIRQTRITFDLPTPVLASEGLLVILSRLGERTIHSRMILFLVILMAANYALGSATRLVVSF